MRQKISPLQLAQRMSEKRAALRLSIRQAADQAGVSPSTFARVMNGKYLPDYERLVLLAEWVGMPLENLTVNIDMENSIGAHPSVIHSSGETTLESIALHLRADEQLVPEDVELLMDMLRVAYQDLVKRHVKATT